MVGALFGFAGNVHGFDADPVFDPTVSITSTCNFETGQVEWTATVDNLGRLTDQQLSSSLLAMRSSPLKQSWTWNRRRSRARQRPRTVTIGVELLKQMERLQIASYSESCEAFNPVVTIDVCSLTTGDVTWTASCTSSSTVAQCGDHDWRYRSRRS